MSLDFASKDAVRGKHAEAAKRGELHIDKDPAFDENSARMTAEATGLRPTPKQIDEIVELYEEVRDTAELADEEFENAKLKLIELVQRFGSVPKGAEQSLRLQGALTILTVTTGTSIAVKDDAVAVLRDAMLVNRKAVLFTKMFGARAKYELLKGAENHLRIAQLPQRLAENFTRLYARCFDVKKKSPSLKIERLTDKPAKKPRAKKAVA